MKTYDHQAVEWINEEGQRECRRCPRLLTGVGGTLRHVDEAIPPGQFDPENAELVKRAAEVIEQALATMLTDRVNDRDRAEVSVQALHRHGLLVSGSPRRRLRARPTPIRYPGGRA